EDWPYSETTDAAIHTTKAAATPHAVPRRRFMLPSDAFRLYHDEWPFLSRKRASQKACATRGRGNLNALYRFLNSTGTPPWILLVTPVMVVPSAESSPAKFHGCVFGNSQFSRRSFTVKRLSGLSIFSSFGSVVPTSFPTM